MKYTVQKVLRFGKSRKKLIIITFVILLPVIYLLIPKAKKEFETTTVKYGTLTQTISATGKIEPENQAELSFLTGGKLAYIGVKKGDAVKKYQTIASLDQRTVQKKLEITLKDYALQRNSFEDQQDNYGDRKPQDATNDAMRRILENNQSNLDKAVLSVELQDLAKQESVLTSPIDGILIRSDVDTVGANVSPTSKYVVADPLNLVFRVDVDEADIGKVRLDQVVEINLDSYPDTPIKSPVTFIDFTSHDTSTGGTAYTVEAKLPENSSFDYRIGMNGDASIITREKRNIVIIPISSLLDDKYVYIKKQDKFVKKEVKKGLENDLEVEIKDGLEKGDIIALQPQDLEPIKNE